MTVNIVGSLLPIVERPKGAQFCVITKSGLPALFYRIEDIKMNDGTTFKSLQYLSTCGGGWMGSMERDWQKFLDKPQFFAC